MLSHCASLLSSQLRHVRALHIFARRTYTADYADVEVATGSSVAALKKAILYELKMDTAPDCVRLLLERMGGSPVPLDSREKLAAQSVQDGCSVIVEELLARRPTLALAAPLASFPNVLACAPDSAHSPQALQLLSSPASAPLQLTRALSQLLQEHQQRHPSAKGLPLPLFETQAHLELLSTLVHHCSQLAAGAYVGINGSSCRTLVGARGIGKSALLRAFARVAASAFPSVITLYVSGAGLLDPSSSFHAAGLPSLLEAAAAERGVVLRGGHASSNGGLDDALSAHGLRLLLLVDEVDELYRVPSEQRSARAHIMQTLGRLGSMGDSTTGLYSVLLCGSSSSTHALVCGGQPGLEAWFPLLWPGGGVPDLNSSKFPLTVVPSSQCTAVRGVAGMLAALCRVPGGELPVHLLPLARLFAFFVGATPRAVLRAARSCSEEGLCSATPAPSPRLSARAATLYHALLAALLAHNGALRALVRCKSDGTVNLVGLMDGTAPWEDMQVPLQWAEVEAVWGRCAGAAGSDAALLRLHVRELTEHQLLHQRGSCMGHETLWPVTAAQVAGSEQERLGWAKEAARRLAPLTERMSAAGSFLS